MDRKKILLVVDDDERRLESAKGFLRSKGYMVDTAETGEEAIEKSQEGRYNLVLLAVKLVDKEGPEFLTRMRKFIPRANTVIVAGDSSSEDAGVSPDIRPEGYVVDPSDPDGLLKVVEEKMKEQEEVELYRSVIPWTKP